MKKNIKFIGAAAAALLAIAPVVASPMAAQATVVPGGNVTSTNNTATNVNNPYTLKFTSSLNTVPASTAISSLTSDSYVKSVLNVASTSDKNPAIVGLKNTMVATKNSNGSFTQVHSLTAGETYYLVTEVTVNGLNKSQQHAYKSDGTAKMPSNSIPTNQGTLTDIAVAIQFTAVDSTIQGNPYFTNSTNVYSDGQTIPATSVKDGKTVQVGANSVSQIESIIKSMNLSSYSKLNTVAHSSIDLANASTTPDGTTAIKTQLTKQGIKVSDNANGTFTSPSKGFTITLTQLNKQNGKSATLNIFFKGDENGYSNYPVLGQKNMTAATVATTGYKQGENTLNAAPIVTVKLNTNNWAQDILDQFSAMQTATNGKKLLLTTQNLSSSNMNTHQSGLYDATLKATNTAGNTTTLNFKVAVVGDELDSLATKTVYGDNNEVIKLVSIVDGKVSNINGNVVNQGQTITVYPKDTKTVDGVEYTRVYNPSLSRVNSNWIATKYITAPVNETGVSMTIMHNAYYYKKDGKNRTKLGDSDMARSYTEVPLVATPVKIGNKTFFKVPNKDVYINAGNITGTKRTLKHNAYIYNYNGKRIHKNTVLKKGTSHTTYGASFNRHGKKYYRIAKGQYVKVANFK